MEASRLSAPVSRWAAHGRFRGMEQRLCETVVYAAKENANGGSESETILAVTFIIVAQQAQTGS
ncbi:MULTISPECIES: hypothetical protein [unclassified Mesorhizobium]|uniref:hypothetical protein n=1 Tax=unclassified Mesorhizobium TaxID=325217 RepID=UPI00112BE68A|nr:MULTISPECIES: hypothetical protein [unclassified Mesorhizobium]MCA0032100.1 hypothetical protein [Mesorhizobium sp. B263B2A]TPN51291.1 hypothetical protein FJ978_13225 [Mesorhizobium sp. B1-1-7]TPN56553.1 hypothetical protein FJ976_05855 [Mesorhizobium sp. B1-1-9]